MEQREIRAMLEQVAKGEMNVDDAMLQLKKAPYEDLGFAKIDTHRALRQGAAEVIYGAGKTARQIADIASAMYERGQNTILITRMDQEKAGVVAEALPLRYDAMSRVGIVGEMPPVTGNGTIVVATGGTSDVPVAEEAALTAEALGNRVVRLYDVGVAGLHRLLSHLDEIMNARGHRRHCGHGGCAGQRHWRTSGLPGDCGTHFRGLWSELRRTLGAAEYAEFLCQRYQRGEH